MFIEKFLQANLKVKHRHSRSWSLTSHAVTHKYNDENIFKFAKHVSSTLLQHALSFNLSQK